MNIRAYFLVKIRKISSACHLLNMLRKWQRLNLKKFVYTPAKEVEKDK